MTIGCDLLGVGITASAGEGLLTLLGAGGLLGHFRIVGMTGGRNGYLFNLHFIAQQALAALCLSVGSAGGILAGKDNIHAVAQAGTANITEVGICLDRLFNKSYQIYRSKSFFQ
jgi:hypothetical protein